MHFLLHFGVMVLSVRGRFQIKLWRALAFKLVISGDYLAAVELTFFYSFSGPKLDYVTLLCRGSIKCPSLICYHSHSTPHPHFHSRSELIGSGESPERRISPACPHILTALQHSAVKTRLHSLRPEQNNKKKTIHKIQYKGSIVCSFG